MYRPVSASPDNSEMMVTFHIILQFTNIPVINIIDEHWREISRYTSIPSVLLFSNYFVFRSNTSICILTNFRHADSDGKLGDSRYCHARIVGRHTVQTFVYTENFCEICGRLLPLLLQDP